MALICNELQTSQTARDFPEVVEKAALTLFAPTGPPGPPDKVTVEEITDSTAQLSWTPGRDNGSPITGYIVQARTPFTVGWQAVDTGSAKTLFHYLCQLLRGGGGGRVIYLSLNLSPVMRNLDCLLTLPVPEVVNGNMLTAAVVGLNAWVEYEFRVVARNAVGLGVPSPASTKTRTEDASTWNLQRHFRMG